MKRLALFALTLGLLLGPIAIEATARAVDSGAKTGFEKGISDSGNLQSEDCKAAGGKVSGVKCLDSAGHERSPVSVTIQNVVNLLLYIAGIIAVIYIVIGGMRYVLSNGDSSAASKGRDTILYAVIGLVVAILAYAIVNFVLGKL
jgi:type IV secretory pathway VirB2 component (pilin)